MKKFLLAAVGSATLLGVAVPALAADMAVKAAPPPMWPRFTVGPASTSVPTVVGFERQMLGCHELPFP